MTSNLSPVYKPTQLDAATLISGGAGFVGQHVVRLLAESGRTTVALYHHKLPESLDNVYHVCSDMSSAELLAAPLRGIDTVIHLAWEGGLVGPSSPIRFHPSDPGPLPRNAQIMRNLMTAMERAGTRRIVFLSAVGACRHAQSTFLQEKYLGEHLVLNSKIPEKVIIRTAVVWGGLSGGDKFLRSILRIMKYPVYPVPRRQESMAPVHVRDLAATIVAASQHELQDPAVVVDVQGQEHYPVQDLFKIVSQRCVKGARFPLPAFLSSPLLPLLERDSVRDQALPKISHFLAIGGNQRDHEAPPSFASVIPKQMASFRESILE